MKPCSPSLNTTIKIELTSFEVASVSCGRWSVILIRSESCVCCVTTENCVQVRTVAAFSAGEHSTPLRRGNQFLRLSTAHGPLSGIFFSLDQTVEPFRQTDLVAVFSLLRSTPSMLNCLLDVIARP